MRRTQEISNEAQAMTTLVKLTSVFEDIASSHIAKIKNQVQQSQGFFNELWHIYTQIRVDNLFRFGRSQASKVINKELFIIITGEGGFSGDLDEKLIDWMLTQFDAGKHDVIVIGHHGALQLANRDVRYKKYFKLPAHDLNINVSPLVSEVQQYKATTVYYQTYVSLNVQDIKRIALGAAVQQQGKSAGQSGEIISEQNYIFEPSTFEVVNHLETSMLHISLSQVLLESKLAQYASRFQAMSRANDKAKDQYDELHNLLNRAQRAVKDERLKEVVNGLKKAKVL